MTVNEGSGRWLLFGHPDDPRIKGFSQALRSSGFRGDIYIHPYKRAVLPDILTSGRGEHVYVRFESPSYCRESVLALLRLGNTMTTKHGFSAAPAISEAEIESGIFVPPAPFYYGLQQQIRSFRHQLSGVSTTFLNQENTHSLTADKNQCHRFLIQNEFAAPRASYTISSSDAFWQWLEQQPFRRAFIKTRFGSAATGILAVSHLSNHHYHAWTTLRQENGIFFNTLKLSALKSREHISSYIDYLAQWGLQTEEWIPRYRIREMQCDCRLVLTGQPTLTGALRCSRTPVTNLHLLNQRLPLNTLLEQLPASTRNHLKSEMFRLKALFPDDLQLSADVAIHADGRSHRILELNTFGDYVRNTGQNGAGSYDLQLQQLSGSL